MRIDCWEFVLLHAVSHTAWNRALIEAARTLQALDSVAETFVLLQSQRVSAFVSNADLMLRKLPTHQPQLSLPTALAQ